MYFELTSDHSYLEYIKDIITIEHNSTYLKVESYDILNLITIMSNLFPGATVDSFIIGNLTLTQDKEGIYINDSFYISDAYVEDLITLLHQANNIRSKLVKPKSTPSGGASSKVTA